MNQTQKRADAWRGYTARQAKRRRVSEPVAVASPVGVPSHRGQSDDSNYYETDSRSEDAIRRARLEADRVKRASKILNDHASAPIPAKQRWNEAMAVQKGKGVTGLAAVKAIDSHSPGLRMEMLQEANSSANEPVANDSARLRWERAMGEQRSKGVSGGAAVKAIELSHPGLRAAMIKEVNNRGN